MAKGYPDYFGMPFFPSYGPPVRQEEVNGTIGDGEQLPVFHVSAKGRLYGGWIQIIPDAIDPVQIRLYLWIDGEAVFYATLAMMLDWNISAPGYLPLGLIRYDYDSGTFVVCPSVDMTFGSEYLLEIGNGTGADLSVNAELHYARII